MFRKKEKLTYPRVCQLMSFWSVTALALALMTPPGKAQTRIPSKADFCAQLGKTIQASSGAQMYCFGPQTNGPGASLASQSATVAAGAKASKGLANVDAANPAEDRTNSGVYVGGQSETSISASGNYVVEAWNDGTGFFAACGSSNYKEELTGYGFSSDGGKTFTDLGGLPNNNCNNSRWVGDPSVGTYSNSGSTYFYISSLYSCSSFSGCPNQTFGGVAVALSACQVTGNTLSCGQPTIVATGNCNGVSNTDTTFCFAFLDKDYLVVDQARKRLYVTFTDFTETYDGTTFTALNAIEMAACDLDNPLAPVCSNGANNGQPYVTVQLTDTVDFCEYEGAYPAVRASTGDVYVGYEYNWATNVFGFGGPCTNSQPTLVIVAAVPGSCLPDPDQTPLSPCAPPFKQNSNIIISTDVTAVPGYNRFFMNDFPRIAVSEPYNTVSLVWNDARNTPLGDILLQSYDLNSLSYIQGSPVQLNTDHNVGDMHTMPGLKNASSDGLLNVTWYDRRGTDAGTGKTDIYGALNVKPTISSSPSKNDRITNQSTDWLATSSVIVPNFGDYTDNFVSASNTLFVAWSDGRSGVPQPYEANVGVR
jgi:hypothetical protein